MTDPASPKSSTFHTALEATKHPLVVLVAATLLGSALIPYVNTRIAQQNRRKALRIVQSLPAFRARAEPDRRVNELGTQFTVVAKNNSCRDAVTSAPDREQLIMLHAQFNRGAGWWYWRFLQLVRVLRLLDD